MDEGWKAIEYGSEFPIEVGRGVPLADGGGYVCLRSGRDALRLVARAMRESGVDAVLMPCYCCECMEWPFSNEGMSVVYYRVSEGLKVDIDDVAEKAAANRGAAFLYMHYYCLPSIERKTLLELKETYSLSVVRDVTHDMLDYSFEEGAVVDDFAVSSLRKWAGLPEGGLAFSLSTRLPSVPVVDDEYGVLRREAMAAKRKYLETADGSLKPPYLEELARCNDLLDRLRETSGMGDESRSLGGGGGLAARVGGAPRELVASCPRPRGSGGSSLSPPWLGASLGSLRSWMRPGRAAEGDERLRPVLPLSLASSRERPRLLSVYRQLRGKHALPAL